MALLDSDFSFINSMQQDFNIFAAHFWCANLQKAANIKNHFSPAAVAAAAAVAVVGSLN